MKPKVGQNIVDVLYMITKVLKNSCTKMKIDLQILLHFLQATVCTHTSSHFNHCRFHAVHVTCSSDTSLPGDLPGGGWPLPLGTPSMLSPGNALWPWGLKGPRGWPKKLGCIMGLGPCPCMEIKLIRIVKKIVSRKKDLNQFAGDCK